MYICDSIRSSLTVGVPIPLEVKREEGESRHTPRPYSVRELGSLTENLILS